MVEQTGKSGPPRQFGLFYPRGYVIVVFSTPEAAEQLRRALTEGGYDDQDIKILGTARVLAGTTANLEQLNPLVAMLGPETSTTKGHRFAPSTIPPSPSTSLPLRPRLFAQHFALRK